MDEAFGARLRVLLDEHLKLTIAQVSDALGYESTTTVRRALSGKGAIDLEKLFVLAKVRAPKGGRPNLDWLITGAGQPLLEGPAPEHPVRSEAKSSGWNRWLTKDRQQALRTIIEGTPLPPE